MAQHADRGFEVRERPCRFEKGREIDVRLRHLHVVAAVQAPAHGEVFLEDLAGLLAALEKRQTGAHVAEALCRGCVGARHDTAVHGE